MPRQTYEQQMQQLKDDVLVLGSMVRSALLDAVQALKARDREQSRHLIASDREINTKRFEIENRALRLIATQQPVASDLRTVAAVLEITSELERIGDYGKGIAKINLLLGEAELIKPLIDIPQMARIATEMLEHALDAFVANDVDLARSIPDRDDDVDDLYNQVYRELLALIMANPRTMDQANYLQWAAHNLERAADRVINICERVIFAVTGVMAEMDAD